MSIEAMKRGLSGPRVKAVCDDCGKSMELACDYLRQSTGEWLPNEGQALRKMSGHGWTHIKGKLRQGGISIDCGPRVTVWRRAA